MRYSSKDIIEIGRLTSGSSAQFIGYNTKSKRKGIYKQNGCVIGIDNDDIREKLSSEILSLLDINTANIDLVYDEETHQNSYFSNYIIQDGEELVAPDTIGCESQAPNPIDNMCERYIQGVKKLTHDEQLIENSKKNFYKYTYMCCILDCYDIKPDNLPLVYNKKSNSFAVAPWFDFGTAFYPEHKSAPIYEMKPDEMLESLFENHYEDIQELVSIVHSNLTTDKIFELLNSEYVTQSMSPLEVQNILARLNEQITKSKQLELEKKPHIISKNNKFKSFLSNFMQKISAIFNKQKQLPSTLGETQTAIQNSASVDSPNKLDVLSTLINESPTEVESRNTNFPPPEL